MSRLWYRYNHVGLATRASTGAELLHSLHVQGITDYLAASWLHVRHSPSRTFPSP
jgi:hypothetical protein